jgi:hypothetical protein
LPFIGYAQWGPELFNKYDNGLLYSDSVIRQLQLNTDSLQTVYENSNTAIYSSRPQARGHYVRLKKDVLSAVKDMNENISFANFLTKYSCEVVDTDLLITKTRYVQSSGDTTVKFSSLELGQIDHHWLTFKNQPKLYRQTVENKWIIEYWPKGDYYDEYVDAYYFAEEFTSAYLPEKYCQQISYSEVIIGLSQPLFSEGAREVKGPMGGWIFVDPDKIETDAFLIYINKLTNKPVNKNYSSPKRYQKELEKWRDTRIVITDSLKDTPLFKQRLNNAYENALISENPNTNLNLYFNRYLSEKKLLVYYRSYYYIGGGSTDQTPRSHVNNVTSRAAKTSNWEVFIKGHLDLLYDNISRMSDLSSMDEYRNTYLNELTAIKLDVVHLLFGTTYSIGNAHELHYSGNVRRLGRILSELETDSKYKDEILSIIKDEGLDDYNRVMFYYLYLNYNYNLEDEAVQKRNEIDLKIAIESLPKYIAEKLLAR